MQLNKRQYTILYRIARSQNSMACYKRRGCAKRPIPTDPDMAGLMWDLMQANAESAIPCDAPLWIERQYQRPQHDRLQEKQDREHGYYFNPTIAAMCQAAHRLGQAYERAILTARSTKNPADFDPAIAAEQLLTRLHTEEFQQTYTYWSYVEGRNSIRKARGLDLLNH